MSLSINDFTKPTSHPFGMLDGYKNESEKEQMLVFMLCQCIKNKNIDAVIKTQNTHPTMVKDGLLECVDGHAFKYRLTNKSKNLLVKFYPSN